MDAPLAASSIPLESTGSTNTAASPATNHPGPQASSQ